MSKSSLDATPLGKTSEYISVYSPALLSPIRRAESREALGLSSEALPFSGADLWTAYEISWLNQKGKPLVAVGYFSVPCGSPNLIESKSFKLYLNSFNQSRFDDLAQVQELIQSDLSKAAGATVSVDLQSLESSQANLGRWRGKNIDGLDVQINDYDHRPELLQLTSQTDIVEETLCSDLLKSNCPVTGQPDWASVMVKYRGPTIDPESLLKYIISFRQHEGFHESCVEQIFTDVTERCSPEQLTIAARYTRRGGLDINPYRSNCGERVENIRLLRQ